MGHKHAFLHTEARDLICPDGIWIEPKSDKVSITCWIYIIGIPIGGEIIVSAVDNELLVKL